MTFLHGMALSTAIQRTLQGKRQDVAVAFIGDGAAERLGIKLGSQARIVCDLFSGACNPAAIQELRQLGVALKRRDRLHAKVYLGDAVAVVASANASTNGFAEEGVNQDFGLEAGITTRDPRLIRAISDWFEEQFRRAVDVTDEDMAKLEALWLRRPRRAVNVANIDASVLARAIRDPASLPGLGFVFSNTVAPKDEQEAALRDIKQEHPEHASKLTTKLSAFHQWSKSDVRKWPEVFLAYHLGAKSKLYLNGNIFFLDNRKRGDVFASRNWTRIARNHLGGASKDSVLAADRSVAMQIMNCLDGGKVFPTALHLSEFYRDSVGEIAGHISS